MSKDELDEYMCLLEKIYESIRKETPAAFILCGDFNARSPLFWEGDFENTEGRLFNHFLTSNHLEQLINEPTHVRDDGSLSCVDLIWTDQPFTFMETGVLPSLDPCSKHNIIHGSINISVPRPPPYKRKIWEYKSANTDKIRADLLNLNWNDLFFNLNVHEKGLVFTDAFIDIVDKQISNKIITCNDKDAPWITSKVKTAVKRNSRVYRKWVKRGKITNDYDNVREVRNSTNKLIKEAKFAYYTKLGIKLSDPEIGHKHFWTAYKRIANKKRDTNIPPIIDDDIFISNFKKKADLFNDYFANQCTINDNGSILPRVVPKTNGCCLMCLLQKNKLLILSIISVPIKHTATMVYPSLCLNYAQLRLLALSKLFFRIALILASFQIVGNMLMCNLFTKKITVKS